MPDISNSVPTDLPSTRALTRSTAIALAVSGLILGTVVLPAEYGVDPTGVGGALGLTRMGEIKVSLAAEARTSDAGVSTVPAGQAEPCAEGAPAVAATSAPLAATPTAEGAATLRTDTTTITLQPNQGREIKLSMREGARVAFFWSTDRGVVNYDQHADSEEPPRDYHGYRKGSGVATDEGELVAAFDGWHGWFWRNRGAEPVTVTLRASGDYREIQEVK